jgi:hypothetical protein
MNAPTLRPTPRRLGLARPGQEPLRTRAALPALRGTWPRPRPAAHDFLVPNPRPDLTTDLNTLRMLEVA